MEILRWMRASTPEECQEVGELLLDVGVKKRTRQWFANIDEAIRLQSTPEELDMAEQLRRARLAAQATRDEG